MYHTGFRRWWLGKMVGVKSEIFYDQDFSLCPDLKKKIGTLSLNPSFTSQKMVIIPPAEFKETCGVVYLGALKLFASTLHVGFSFNLHPQLLQLLYTCPHCCLREHHPYLVKPEMIKLTRRASSLWPLTV